MRNIKTALRKSSNTALLFAAASGLLNLTACSSDVNYNNPGIEVSEGNVTIGNNPNDQAGRITFFGTPGTRADEDALKGVFPEVGSVPNMPGVLPTYTSPNEEDQDHTDNTKKTAYCLTGGSGQINLYGGVIYITGEVSSHSLHDTTDGNKITTIYVMPGAKLTLTANNETAKIVAFGDLIIPGNITNKEKGQILVKNDLIVEGELANEGTIVVNENLTVVGQMKFNGDGAKVKAKCINVLSNASQAVVTNGDAVLAVRSYMVCENLYVQGNSKIYLWPNAMIDVDGKTSMTSGTCGFYYYTTDPNKRGEDQHALLRTGTFHVEGGAENLAYTGGLFQKQLKVKYTNFSPATKANDFVTSADAYYIPSDNKTGKGCNPGNGKPGNKDFDEIAVVEGPEHEHNFLSATCVQAVGGRAYVSYHLNEAYADNAELPSKHMGCIEVFDITENKAQITSWLRNEDFDFNHLLVDGSKVYTVGDTKNFGATLGEITLGTDGNFGKYEMDTEGRGDVMTYYNLYKKTEANRGSSGNCIVRDGNFFRIASYQGFQSLNVNDLTEEGDFIATTGSAKHIAKSANYIATLNLDQKGSDTSTATVTVYNPWGTLVNSFKTHDVITPINGKNVIAIDGDVIYVALGQNGVGKYSITTGEKLGAYSWIAEKLESLGEDETYDGKPLANGLCVDEKYVYVANGGAGLIVLDKNDMKRVARHSRTSADTEYSANYVQKVGDLIYVAYGRNGLEIVKLVE